MTAILTGAEALASLTDPIDYAKEFTDMLDAYHSKPEVFDDELDAQLHEQFAEILKERQFFDFRSAPYFSPSSANSCPRELYMKLRKAKRDKSDRQPHQGRWVRHGTAIGDSLQRDILFIEKHYAKIVGDMPAFRFLRTKKGYPAFEDFVKTMKEVRRPDSNGEIQTFNLFGKPDGLMAHKDGTRIGLEIKSKQTTAQQTGHYKMRAPKDDHFKQCVCYAVMYDIRDFLIVYVNGSKKGWVLDVETYAKNPDVRAFHVKVTDEDIDELMGEFAELVRRSNEGDAPKLQLSQWNFNNYKRACALDLSEEEVSELNGELMAIEKSNVPGFIKQNHRQALDEILELRKG